MTTLECRPIYHQVCFLNFGRALLWTQILIGRERTLWLGLCKSRVEYRERDEGALKMYLVRQCESKVPFTAATYRSSIEIRANPMQAPAIAPADLGVQLWKYRASPPVKCR